MKRKSPLPFFWETAAPLLPVTAGLLDWQNALQTAFLAASVYLALAMIFKILAPVFPKRLWAPGLVLTVCAVFYAWPGLKELRAPLALSVCMLALPFEEARKPQGVRHLILKAIGFFILAVYLGAAQEVLGRHLQWPLFQRIPGVFLLLVIPAVVWPASRKQKGLGRVRRMPSGGVPA
jgi:hypothetical protein